MIRLMQSAATYCHRMSFYLTQPLHRALQQRGSQPATVFGARRQTWSESAPG